MLKIAALLILITSLAHSYLGERYLFSRLFKVRDLPPLLGDSDFLKATLRFTWHITTVTWLGIGAVLALDASPSSFFLLMVSAISLICAGLAIYFTRGKHLSWLPLLTVSLICVLETF